MPKVVDHEAKRRELVDALLRIVVRNGIGAVSVRTVAEEAGCSVRPVQYYFENKAELLAAAHARVSERMTALLTDAVRGLGDEPTPRAVIETIVRTFLPTTEEARNAVIAYYCFYAAELTDATLRIPGAAATTKGLAQVIGAQVERHRSGGLSTDVTSDVTLLVLSISTLASSVIAGYRPLEDAISLLDHQIDRLLPQPSMRPNTARGHPPAGRQQTPVRRLPQPSRGDQDGLEVHDE